MNYDNSCLGLRELLLLVVEFCYWQLGQSQLLVSVL